jgi:uncharacterized protein with von Willebrand factor type A (vWA) domain
MSKGSNRRPDQSGKFDDNFDKIFGNKESSVSTVTNEKIDEIYKYKVVSRDDRRVSISYYDTLEAAREFIRLEVDSLWPNWHVNSHCIHYVRRSLKPNKEKELNAKA